MFNDHYFPLYNISVLLFYLQAKARSHALIYKVCKFYIKFSAICKNIFATRSRF